MLGTPVAVRAERWAMARSVVSGRLINGYSSHDWLLGLVYRCVLCLPWSSDRSSCACSFRLLLAFATRNVPSLSVSRMLTAIMNQCRGSNGFIKAAGGLCPVDVPGIENVNLSSIIEGALPVACSCASYQPNQTGSQDVATFFRVPFLDRFPGAVLAAGHFDYMGKIQDVAEVLAL